MTDPLIGIYSIQCEGKERKAIISRETVARPFRRGVTAVLPLYRVDIAGIPIPIYRDTESLALWMEEQSARKEEVKEK